MEKKSRRIQFRRQLDSPWSWVVCFSSFTVQFLILGTHNSFGSFFVALLDKFQRSEAETGKNLALFSANTVDCWWIIYCNNRLRRKTLSIYIFCPPYRQKKLFSDRFSRDLWNKDSYFLLLYLAARSNEWQVLQTNHQNAKQADNSTDNVKFTRMILSISQQGLFLARNPFQTDNISSRHWRMSVIFLESHVSPPNRYVLV